MESRPAAVLSATPGGGQASQGRPHGLHAPTALDPQRHRAYSNPVARDADRRASHPLTDDTVAEAASAPVYGQCRVASSLAQTRAPPHFSSDVPQHPHLPRADRSRSLRSRRADSRPAPSRRAPAGGRGTLEAAALREFLADVAWGALDELLVDLPPGVHRFAELAELLPGPPAVLVVTIPTPESRDAVRRALRAAVERQARPLGVVENMVGGPFAGSAADDLAGEFGMPVLARIPWHPTPDTWAELAGRVE